MLSFSIIQRSALGLALLVTVGILVHDTKLDQATATALALPAMLVTFEAGGLTHLGTGEHTHVERVSFSQGVSIPGGGMPRIQPREDNRRYVMPRHISKGLQGFDGYYLPDVQPSLAIH